MISAERSKSVMKWLVGLFVILPIFTIGGCIGLGAWVYRAESKNLQLADGLWNEGKHEDALKVYQKGNYGDIVLSSDKARHSTIYQRCIEREFSTGNIDSAKILALRAAGKNLSLIFSESKIQEVFNSALQTVELERAAAIKEAKERVEGRARSRFAKMSILELGEFIDRKVASKGSTTRKIWQEAKSEVYSNPDSSYRLMMQILRHEVDAETASALEELARKIEKP